MFQHLLEILTEIGFKSQDISLLALCPLFSVIGGFVHMLMLRADFSRIPNSSVGHVSLLSVIERIGWSVSRLLLSAAIGLVFGLYLVGALTESPNTVARILAFSIILGYAAPRLWASQEKIVNEVVDERLRKILKESDLFESKGTKVVSEAEEEN